MRDEICHLNGRSIYLHMYVLPSVNLLFQEPEIAIEETGIDEDEYVLNDFVRKRLKTNLQLF